VDHDPPGARACAARDGVRHHWLSVANNVAILHRAEIECFEVERCPAVSPPSGSAGNHPGRVLLEVVGTLIAGALVGEAAYGPV
jgi:hypothetical protein